MVRIKQRGLLDRVRFLMFPSHNGSDQTEHRDSRFEGSEIVSIPQWFGSNQFILFCLGEPVCFHPTMVRIKQGATKLPPGATIVSIPQWFGSNGIEVPACRRAIYLFPSHNGSDQTEVCSSMARWKVVSIPQWFGSNEDGVIVIRPEDMFPSHNGSDQTKQ